MQSLNEPLKLEQRKHQVEGTAWLQRVGRGLLADPPRTGKTNQLLLAAEGRTLVVAPPSLKGTWLDEHAKWRPDLDLTFVGYTSVARRVRSEVTGRRSVTIPHPKPELKGPWDTMICDESHNLTNPKADWTGAVSRIESDRLFLATGTPIPNWAQDLLMTLRLLYPGDKRFTNKDKWLRRWFKVWEPPWGGTQIGDLREEDGVTWPEFWRENGLDGSNGRMLQRDVDLGVPFTEQDIDCPMTPKQRLAYADLADSYCTEVEGKEISAWSAGGLHTKLHQVSTGLEALGTGATGSGKMGVLRELLRDGGGQPTIAFCQYRATVAAVADLGRSMGLTVGVIDGGVAKDDRDPIRREFQAGRIQLLVGSLGTTSVGLTLSRASTEIFVEHAWVPWRNDQALKRAMELGKTSHVHVFHLWTPATVDTGMRKLVADKSEQQVKALRAREFRGAISG